MRPFSVPGHSTDKQVRPMDYLPIFLNLNQRPCLVVGGGEVAARKAALLMQAGARVKVVSPQLSGTLDDYRQEGRIDYRAGEFAESDIGQVDLIIAATDIEAVNVRVSELAKARGIPVNVVDRPDLCSFIMPSIVDRSPVQIAVSTGGASPVLARMLRARLETLIPASYGRLAKLVDSFREKVQARFGSVDERRRFWETVIDGPIAEKVFAGQDESARADLEKAISSGGADMPARGEVYLVGAGPGDPDLLTFRALRLLQQADVLVYDRLVSEPILELARRDAQRIYVGKEKNYHIVPQEDINQLLVRLAKEGKRVVRLKGGDPFIFGRGGEEIDTLADEGITFQVVPGITAAAGCAAYSGIPLTHRDYAQSVVFATGHLKDNTFDLNWDALLQPNQTIVFYMGLSGCKNLCGELIRRGKPANTPVALVQQGTTQNQKIYIGELATMHEVVEKQEIKPPTLIIVGEVVKLHEKLAWFQPQGE